MHGELLWVFLRVVVLDGYLDRVDRGNQSSHRLKFQTSRLLKKLFFVAGKVSEAQHPILICIFIHILFVLCM